MHLSFILTQFPLLVRVCVSIRLLVEVPCVQIKENLAGWSASNTSFSFCFSRKECLYFSCLKR